VSVGSSSSSLLIFATSPKRLVGDWSIFSQGWLRARKYVLYALHAKYPFGERQELHFVCTCDFPDSFWCSFTGYFCRSSSKTLIRYTIHSTVIKRRFLIPPTHTHRMVSQIHHYRFYCYWLLWPLLLLTVSWSLAPPKFTKSSVPRPTTPLSFQTEVSSSSSSSSSLVLELPDLRVAAATNTRRTRKSWIPRLAYVLVSQFQHALPQNFISLDPQRNEEEEEELLVESTVKATTTITTNQHRAFFKHKVLPPAFGLESFSTHSISEATSISDALVNFSQDIPTTAVILEQQPEEEVVVAEEEEVRSQDMTDSSSFTSTESEIPSTESEIPSTESVVLSSDTLTSDAFFPIPNVDVDSDTTENNIDIKSVMWNLTQDMVVDEPLVLDMIDEEEEQAIVEDSTTTGLQDVDNALQEEDDDDEGVWSSGHVAFLDDAVQEEVDDDHQDVWPFSEVAVLGDDTVQEEEEDNDDQDVWSPNEVAILDDTVQQADEDDVQSSNGVAVVDDTLQEENDDDQDVRSSIEVAVFDDAVQEEENDDDQDAWSSDEVAVLGDSVQEKDDDDRDVWLSSEVASLPFSEGTEEDDRDLFELKTLEETVQDLPSCTLDEELLFSPQEEQQDEEDEKVEGNSDNLAEIQSHAAEIAHSFYAKEFRPAFFAKNPHLQTIVGTLARQESMYFPATGNLILSKFQWDQRERVETPDGDFFDVDWKYTSKPVEDATVLAQQGTYFLEPKSRTPLVLICHGLQSNTDSPLTKDMAISFNNVGMDVAAINFRGCSGEPNRTPMGYHLSYTDDLEFMVQRIAKQFPGRSIYLSGFSLGANVVTKFLADIGTKATTDYNICGAAVNAVPFDLTKTQAINRPGFSGSVYGDRLVESLRNRVYESMDAGIEYNFTREELAKCKNCKEFDNLVVCSVYEDFEDADDYHRKSSTYDRLHEVMVPQFMLQARDDPFFAGATLPVNDRNLACKIKYTKHGGHCGYVFHADERDKVETSFMPRELARFVEHVHEVRTGQRPSTIARRMDQEVTDSSPKTPELPAVEVSEEVSQERRRLAAEASHSFEHREFNPAFWAQNEHVQTILGTLFRKESMYLLQDSWTSIFKGLMEPKATFQWDERQRMTTPDNDFFDVDWKYVDQQDSQRPLVLICHGLQSNSESPLAQDMAKSFNNVGMDVACINFRGCSGEINKSPVGYHLGFTDDLKQMILHVNTMYPGRRIYLSGFSLGANVVTACLAELGEKAYDYNVYGAAVNAVPFDMPKANRNLNQNGFTKSLYGNRLLTSMVDRIEESYGRIKFHFPKEEASKCQTIMDMENLVIAPIFGFKDANDYYEKTSTLHKVDQVAVPELVIQARDDPFFVGQSMPNVIDPTRPLRIQQTEHGGHCGYILHNVSKMTDPVPETSWMPTELARFLLHIENTFAATLTKN